jgi:hypothetical protein
MSDKYDMCKRGRRCELWEMLFPQKSVLSDKTVDAESAPILAWLVGEPNKDCRPGSWTAIKADGQSRIQDTGSISCDGQLAARLSTQGRSE